MASPPDAQITKRDRLKKLRILLGLSQLEFGQALARDGVDVSQNYISAIEGGRRNIGPDVQHRIQERFNVRKAWLDEGVGEIFNLKPERGVPPALSEQQQQLVADGLQRLEVVRTKGGNLTWVSARDQGLFLRTDGKAPTLPRTDFHLLPQEGFAFEVVDSSMLPDFAPGSYVVCTRLEAPDDMLPGRPYLVQTSNRLLLGLFEGRMGDELNLTTTYPVRQVGYSLPAADVRHSYYVELKLVRP